MPELILDGEWEKGKTFRYHQRLETAAAWAEVTTSYAKTDTPVQVLTAGDKDCEKMREGIIKRIHVRLNPTNAVTYTLRIWRRAVSGDMFSNLYMLYESPSGLVDDTDYDFAELDIPFSLAVIGTIYFGVEWSGAAGDTNGFIDVSGVRLD